MRNKLIGKCFQIEIAIYSLISVFYTVITEIIIYTILFYAKQLIEHEIGKDGQAVKGMEFGQISFSGYFDQNSEDIPIWIILSIIIGIMLFFFYFHMLTKKFIVYLKEITDSIREIAEGNFDTRIEVKNDDELALIALKINEMASDIGKIVEQERMNEIEKHNLITCVAHDLRTPLTSIIGYLELTTQSDIDDEKKDKYITIAYEKSMRLQALIEELFRFTKFSSEEIQISRQKLDFVMFVEQMVEEFYPSFQENELEYYLNTKESSIPIEIDGNLMARAIANILSNAVKYGKNGKQLIIDVEREGNSVCLKVTNYGEIIPQKDIENVFRRFYRVDQSRSYDTGGTGLGLAITKKIVELHNGSITVKSDYNGTVFEIILPLSQ